LLSIKYALERPKVGRRDDLEGVRARRAASNQRSFEELKIRLLQEAWKHRHPPQAMERVAAIHVVFASGFAQTPPKEF